MRGLLESEHIAERDGRAVPVGPLEDVGRQGRRKDTLPSEPLALDARRHRRLREAPSARPYF